jgi:phosphoenolpyruvate-protein phosphotransferase
MLALDSSEVRIGGSPRDKTDAIRQVGALLVQSGHIEAGYVASMLARERVADTFLGNGIAIPHGIPKDRALILKTGVAVLQVPGGVEWNPGERVFLVVGIAAKSDEHLEILSNLTDVLSDEAEAQRLAHTVDPQDIVRRLSSRAPAPSTPSPTKNGAVEDVTEGFEIVIRNPHGLHARPATVLVDVAKKFESVIRIKFNARAADAKSLIALLGLGAGNGAKIRVTAEGSDAEQALAALRQAIEAGLEEEAEAAAEAAAPAAARGPAIAWEGEAIPGVAASPGLAIGPLRQFRRAKIVVAATAKDPGVELKRLDGAIEGAKRELDDLFEEVSKRVGVGKSAIFRAHKEFLEDPELLEEARRHVVGGHSAGWAWQRTYEDRASALANVDDHLVAARAVDLRDVGRRVLRSLAETLEEDAAPLDKPVILIAEDLSPSDTAGLDPTMALGLCTASGGPTSHTAIIARSLDIPAVCGSGASVLELADDTPAILDGDSGLLVLRPTLADLAAARAIQRSLEAQRLTEKRACYQPAITQDGTRIEVVANVAAPHEAEAAVNAGGEGIGLMRTEFLFLQRDSAPSEDEQAEAYTTMTKALNGLPIIIRTLDIGGDKDVPYLSQPAEANPFLGERGIRLCLARPDLFRTQLRAIFRAAATGPVRIMYPMISTMEELMAARKITEQVRNEMNAPACEIGIMVEVPSAALMADQFAREVDFFSVGSNDLTQYVLAMDRLHPVLAKQADGLHPAVLRAIDMTVRAAKAAGKWVGVCGGIAGDPRGVVLLVGLGVSELSVSIPSIAAVKAQIRGLTLAQAQQVAQRALQCRTAAEVRALR